MSTNKNIYITAFHELGVILKNFAEEPDGKLLPYHNQLTKAINLAEKYNAWFTRNNILHAFKAISNYLNHNVLSEWIDSYESTSANSSGKTVGVIMAGNIPLVGFHDFLCVMLSENKFLGKLSTKDKFLLPAICNILADIEPRMKSDILFTDATIKDYDAVIATGSNNTARYFEYYFKSCPHIIRKNRASVAIISENDSIEEIKALNHDIFTYFGLGCRSISKVFFPESFNVNHFLDALLESKDIITHHKYANNYDYYRSIYMLNKEIFKDTGFLIAKEDQGLFSPVSTLFYEFYSGEKELKHKLNVIADNLQCMVSVKPGLVGATSAGKAQLPLVSDYADGVDTMKFLLAI